MTDGRVERRLATVYAVTYLDFGEPSLRPPAHPFWSNDRTGWNIVGRRVVGLAGLQRVELLWEAEVWVDV